MIPFQVIDNGKLPNYSHYPSINQYEENEREYDMIGFSGNRVIKERIQKHNAIDYCSYRFNEFTDDYAVQVDEVDNFCGSKQCALSEPVSKYNREVNK